MSRLTPAYLRTSCKLTDLKKEKNMNKKMLYLAQSQLCQLKAWQTKCLHSFSTSLEISCGTLLRSTMLYQQHYLASNSFCSINTQTQNEYVFLKTAQDLLTFFQHLFESRMQIYENRRILIKKKELLKFRLQPKLIQVEQNLGRNFTYFFLDYVN